MKTAILLIIGVGFSSFVGHFVVKSFVRFLRQRLDVDDLGNTWPGRPAITINAWVTGYFERVFFTIAVALDMSGVLPAMITWLVVKLAASWQYRESEITEPDKTNYRVSSLMGGFLSMLISLVIGLLIRWLIGWHL